MLEILYRGFHHDLRGEGPTEALLRLHIVGYQYLVITKPLRCCYNDKIMIVMRK